MKNIRFYGKKPYHVAVIHGGPGAPGSLAAIARELSKDIGVLEPIQTKSSVDGQVLELHDVIKEYSKVPITLIGHSWGAWLAYIFTARYPSLVNKLILVGSGPFEVKYVKVISENRLSRLSTEEHNEFNSLIDKLNSPNTENKDGILARLGALVSKTDNFKEIIIETEEEDKIPTEGDTFQSVWNEAAELRKTGSLLELGKQIKCPVITIHGDYDPHPAEGVEIPLNNVIDNFQLFLLKKCGHSPWKEEFAKEDFYDLIRNEIKTSI